MKSFFSFFFILFFSSFILASDYPELKVDLIQDSLLRNANAVVRYDINEVTIFSDDRMDIVEYIAITVLNEKAEAYLDFKRSYTEGSTKITDIELVYLNADGDEIYKPKKKEFSDLNAYSNMSIASSQKFKYFDYTASSYPVTIVYSLKTKTSNTCFVPAWYPMGGSKVSLEKSSYTILNETNIPLNISENNFEEYGVNKISVSSYEIENVKPIKVEEYMPPFRNIVPNMHLSLKDFNYEGNKGSADNWSTYGKWLFDSFLKERDSFDKEKLKADILAMCSTDPSKKDIAKAVYKFVQNNTRYISIQLNEGGFKPMSPAKVDEYKYGDCKGLSFYTIALLDLFEIPANYVIVYAGSENKQSLNKSFFNHQQANHAILNIPFEDEIVWLDATSNVAPFNFLGSFTDDRIVLSVNESSIELISTPDYGSSLNHDIVMAKLKLNENGNVSGNYSRDYIGLDYSSIKYKSKKEKKEFDKLYNQNEFENLQKPVVSNVTFKFDEDEFVANESLDLTASKFCEKLGDYLLLPIELIEFDIPKLKKTKRRKYTVNFLRDQKQESFVTVELPENSGYQIEDNVVNYKSEFGEYSCNYSLKNGKIEIKRVFEIFEGSYSKDKFKEIRTFFNKIRKHEKSAINLVNKT